MDEVSIYFFPERARIPHILIGCHMWQAFWKDASFQHALIWPRCLTSRVVYTCYVFCLKLIIVYTKCILNTCFISKLKQTNLDLIYPAHLNRLNFGTLLTLERIKNSTEPTDTLPTFYHVLQTDACQAFIAMIIVTCLDVRNST